MKNLLKDNVRLTYGFDVEKLIKGVKVKVTEYRMGASDKILWVRECDIDRLCLMDEDGISYHGMYYTADSYFNNGNIIINILE